MDETYIGGKRKNMSNAKRNALKDTGRGAVGKVAMVGVEDRETNEVRARAVKATNQKTLHPFIAENVGKDAQVYTDDATVYDLLPFKHESVKHSVSEYVRDMAHTNGVESFWSMLKGGDHSTYHHMSEKHPNRYDVQEFAGRHNVGCMDTIEQMVRIATAVINSRLKPADLIN